MARPAKWEKWREQDGLILLRGWAMDGLTDEQIAHNMGIAKSTLYEWKNKLPELSDALKKGKEVVDYAIVGALARKAMSGDTAAMIFWLKNRQPEKWKDKPDVTSEKALAKLDDVLSKLEGNL